jgi:hypothetical protein
MPTKCLLTFLFVASALSLAIAQDALTAEPTHYRLVFENEFVRVMNIHFEAHDKTAMYSHRSGVVVAMTAGHMKFVDDHGKTKLSSYLPGDTRWAPAVRHTAENLDDIAYSAIMIEVKADRSVSVNRPDHGKDAKDAIRDLNAPTREMILQALSSAAPAAQRVTK